MPDEVKIRVNVPYGVTKATVRGEVTWNFDTERDFEVWAAGIAAEIEATRMAIKEGKS